MAKSALNHRVRGPEPLERRNMPAVTAGLAAGVLSVQGDAARDNVVIAVEGTEIVVRSFATEVARFSSAAVTSVAVATDGGNDVVRIDRSVVQTAVVSGGTGNDSLFGGSGPTTLLGGPGRDKLRAGPGVTALDGGPGADLLQNVKPADTVAADAADRVVFALPVPADMTAPARQLTTDDVTLLLNRAAAATSSTDAIITVVDRNGRLLGVKTEGGVDPTLRANPDLFVYAVDGSLSLARTAAFFANNGAPLTSRTVGFISQTTITQREVEAYPSIPNSLSTDRGPGYVAAIGINGHFPPDVPFTPQVDLFAIEHTNRDSILNPGPDGIKGTGDDVMLRSRFDADPAFIPPGQGLFPPESYGFLSGLRPNAQSRGIATLPGGIPIYRDGQLVGGIGVFFPGKTGFATEENSVLDAKYDPSKPDRSLEAEYMAFAAVGGARIPVERNAPLFPIGAINGLPEVEGVALPSGRIDLVGITLDIFGPGGIKGPERLVEYGRSLGEGDITGAPRTDLAAGLPVPEGWLVLPHDGVGITAAEVQQIIQQGIDQAVQTRAAIRLPKNTPTAMVFAVCDQTGEVVGLFRMRDATVFSIDVAVAKARNVAYYNEPARLQPADQVEGVAPGTAFTARTFRYLALPRFPEGIDGRPPGPFSILNDPGIDPRTGLIVGERLPASAYQSVQGFNSFNPQTNFRSQGDPRKENGVVFFPGSSGVYDPSSNLLIGGFGVSGDGVDQDDVVTAAGIRDFEPDRAYRVDNVFVRGVRLPYQKFNRNPEGGLT